MAEALISTMLRLSPDDMALLRRLVANRVLATGERSSQNEIMRDLIREASRADTP